MKSESNWGKGICLLIGGLFAVVGWCILTFYGKPLLEDAKASSSWPTTAGVVTESRVKRHTDDEGGTTYSPEVVYRYEVDRQKIHADQIWMGANYSSSNRSGHEKVVAKYPVKKEVTVSYKPDDPFIAVLEPGPVYMSYFGIILGWIFFGLGMCFVAGVLIASYFSRKPDVNTESTFRIEDEGDELII